jgi:hypothetical protein
MKHRLFAAVWLVVSAAPLFAADRLTDRDVKQLIARIEDGRDKFDNALDDKFENAILRDASGEVNVKRFLNTFQESIDRVEQSLKPDYAASTEVGTLLRQARPWNAISVSRRGARRVKVNGTVLHQISRRWLQRTAVTSRSARTRRSAASVMAKSSNR